MLIPDTLVFSKEVPDNSSTTAEIDIMANIRIHIKRIEKQNTKVEGGGFNVPIPVSNSRILGVLLYILASH